MTTDLLSSRFLAVGLVFAVLACAENEPPVRIAVARFQAETCTFCPGGDTDIDRWTRLRPILHGEEVLDASDYEQGFRDRAREYGGVELIGLASPYEVFGSSSASWVTEDAFNYFTDSIIADLRRALPVDGVYLALHGAMAVRNVPRPEAEIARRVRDVVGPSIPIVGTFDLHGNEDEQFLAHADMAFVVKRFPHYDAYEQGERAARMLIRTIRGDYAPTAAVRKPGIITATVLQWTGQSPAMDIMERARRWENRERDVYVSVFFGYPWSDVPDVGATAIAITNNDQALADRIAQDMSDYMWRVRERFASGTFPKPPEGVAQIRRAVAAGQTPVAVGDYSDRSGDATHILRALIDQRVSNFIYATLRDEGALAALKAQDAQPGSRFSMAVGGFASPESGQPVQIDGTLVFRGPRWGYEEIAAVEFGSNNLLILTPAYEQIIEPSALAFDPVNLNAYQVFIVKSRAHFRRGFDETGFAKSIIIIDAPGPYVGTTALDALVYEYAPLRQLYPFGTPPDRREGTR